MHHLSTFIFLVLTSVPAYAQLHFSGSIGQSIPISDDATSGYSYYRGEVENGLVAKATLAYGDTLGVALTLFHASNEMNYPNEFAEGSQDENDAVLFGPFVQYDLDRFTFNIALQGGVNFFTASEFNTVFITEDISGETISRRQSYDEYSDVDYGLLASLFMGMKLTSQARIGMEFSYFQSHYNLYVQESYINVENGERRERLNNYTRVKRLFNIKPSLVFSF